MTYFEPFLGSGAIFFYLQPKRAVLSDLNEELIITYQAIRDEYQKVEKELYFHQVEHSKEYYYFMRKRKLRSVSMKAARFIYLNRTCWNGLYRVNKDGEFNVPIGTKSSVILPTDDFEAVSKLLSQTKLVQKDFAEVINKAQKDDFIFIDPPYTVKHNNNNFRKYNERIFSWDDQVKLRNCVASAVSRDVKVLVCNADNPSIIDLYNNVGEIYFVSRHSSLAADPSKRQKTTELVISCNIE